MLTKKASLELSKPALAPQGAALRPTKSDSLRVGILKADNHRPARANKPAAVKFLGGSSVGRGDYEISLDLRFATNLLNVLKESGKAPNGNIVWCSVGARGGEHFQSNLAKPSDKGNKWVWDQHFDIPLFSTADVIAIKIYNNADRHMGNLLTQRFFPAAEFLGDNPTSKTEPLADQSNLTFSAHCRLVKPPKQPISFEKLKEELRNRPPVEVLAAGPPAAGSAENSIRAWLDQHRDSREAVSDAAKLERRAQDKRRPKKDRKRDKDREPDWEPVAVWASSVPRVRSAPDGLELDEAFPVLRRNSDSGAMEDLAFSQSGLPHESRRSRRHESKSDPEGSGRSGRRSRSRKSDQSPSNEGDAPAGYSKKKSKGLLDIISPRKGGSRERKRRGSVEGSGAGEGVAVGA